jgi:hypothetical protein
MEENIFPRPAVAELMKKGFVEARLHADLQKHLTKAQYARNKELQKQMTASTGMPWFVVVDPKTGKKLGETPVVGLSSSAFEENWIKFLHEMNTAAGRN